MFNNALLKLKKHLGMFLAQNVSKIAQWINLEILYHIDVRMSVQMGIFQIIQHGNVFNSVLHHIMASLQIKHAFYNAQLAFMLKI